MTQLELSSLAVTSWPPCSGWSHFACSSYLLCYLFWLLALRLVHMLALLQNTKSVQHLAEFGVVFLMFVIGLEFNLTKLRSMRQHVFRLGFIASGIHHVGYHSWHFTFGPFATEVLANQLANCIGSIGCCRHRAAQQLSSSL